MSRFVRAAAVLALTASTAFAQGAKKEPLVEFEMMTWPEVKAAMDAGKTTALFYTGGTEQRGPQNINGGHTLMARATNKAIALKLGNAIAMPVLAYTPNNASADLPGTIGLTPEILSIVLERLATEAIKTGFKNVIIMGDHGGGQPAAYASVATKLDSTYAPKGIHVYFCDEVYAKAQGDFDKYLDSKSLPSGGHASIPDTSEMWYLGGEEWTRSALLATAVAAPRGQPGNGITGDARPSTKELGRMAFENKVNYANRQIRELLHMPPQ